LLQRLFSNPRLYYLLAHLPHMLLGVALVLVFSRLVVAEEFGQYAKGFAYINVAGALLYGWLQISLLRLAEGKEQDTGPKFTTILLAIALPIAPCFLLAGLFDWLGLIAYPIATASAAVAYGSSVCLSQYARGINNARLYGLLGVTRLLVVFGVAYVLTREVPDASSLLYALAAGGLAATFTGAIFIAFTSLRNLPPADTTPHHETGSVNLNNLFRYGAPASISLVAVMLLIHGDRFVIGLLMSDAETAHYSAQADLARQMIYPIITALSISLVPQALKKNREQSIEIAKKFIAKESTTTLNLILPILIMLLVFGNDIMSIILPTGYVNSTENIAALVAVGAFLTGCRLVRFDPLFHLELQASKIGFSALTGLLCWMVGIVPLIIFYGTEGAACAGILGAIGALVYAYSAAAINGITNPILTKSTIALLLLLIGTAFSIRQFFFNSGETTILDLVMILILLYALSLLFFRWVNAHE
jgi:O-antigen/teichoic acid export membrane protein